MTREERLYAMRGTELIAEAEKLGVKVAHKGNSLKESKEKAIQKILAAEAVQNEEPEVAETEVEEPVVDAIETETAPETEKPKKERKARQPKHTFESLVADIPAFNNAVFIRSVKNAVHVKIGTDHKRLFGYTGTVIVVGDERLVAGLDSEKKSYGYILAPTVENMRAIYANYMA